MWMPRKGCCAGSRLRSLCVFLHSARTATHDIYAETPRKGGMVCLGWRENQSTCQRAPSARLSFRSTASSLGSIPANIIAIQQSEALRCAKWIQGCDCFTISLKWIPAPCMDGVNFHIRELILTVLTAQKVIPHFAVEARLVETALKVYIKCLAKFLP